MPILGPNSDAANQVSDVRTRDDFLRFVTDFSRQWEVRHAIEDSPDDVPLRTIEAGNITVGELLSRLREQARHGDLPESPTWQFVATLLVGQIERAHNTREQGQRG